MAGARVTAMGLGVAVLTIGGGYIITSWDYLSLFLTAAALTAAAAVVFWIYFRGPRGELARGASREEESL